MVSASELQIRDMLKKAGLYCTRSRIAVLRILLKSTEPLSQDQIARRMGKKPLDKVTIYRTLESFCQAALVHRAYVHKRIWYFELASHCHEDHCHPHFKCVNCGKVYCLYDVDFPLVRGLAKDFSFHRQKVLIEGLGPECSSRSK